MGNPETKAAQRLPREVALLGGGVIGGGWAARFMLNGVDVRLYDPAPNAVEQVERMLANARRAYSQLTTVPLPPEGSLRLVESTAEAVRDVDLVQESAPERLELKQQLLAEAGRAAAPGTLICSSTSGLRPSLLQAEMDDPSFMLVAHPFQPVYLLPLVELCGGERTTTEALERAAAIYRTIGMHPLAVRKEIDGFIANRLQEAVSREALWLAHDDVASLQDIDDAVRYSWALRRAAIGSYRMVDGGAGLRQSIAQWSFKWPWSKLTDKPAMDAAFLDRAAEQADALVEADPIAIPVEQKRDDLLVSILQALRSQHYGPGETLAQWEDALRRRAGSETASHLAPVAVERRSAMSLADTGAPSAAAVRDHLDCVPGEIGFTAATPPGAGASAYAATSERREVTIRDARPILNELDLDREGFTLIRHPIPRTQALDPDTLCRNYLADMAPVIGEYFKASRCVPRSDNVFIRRAGAVAVDGVDATSDPRVRVPLGNAHIDYMPISGPMLAARENQMRGTPITSYRRLMIINTWRVLSPPPQDFPLAVCDSSSVSDDDIVPGHFEDMHTGSAFWTGACRYNPLQKWYYFPNMTEDEIIVWKSYDSDQFCKVVHATFDNRRAHPDAIPRESIEGRFYIYYD